MSQGKQKSILSFFQKKPPVPGAVSPSVSKEVTPAKSSEKSLAAAATATAPATVASTQKENAAPNASSQLSTASLTAGTPCNSQKSLKKASKAPLVADESGGEGDQDEVVVSSRPKKRLKRNAEHAKAKRSQRIHDSSSEEEDEEAVSDDYVPSGAEESSSSSEEEEQADMSEGESDSAVAKTPRPSASIKKKSQKTPASASQRTPTVGFGVSAMDKLILGDDRKKARNEKFSAKNEVKYAFLSDIRDAQGRRPNDADYDPRTLLIPNSFWKDATPFEKQYWKIKAARFDTVVFFKKGKFYELFERDADIGSREFDLKLTDRVHMRMVGVPESSFDFWAAKFIAKGYKIAKVDQLETALGKEMREKGGKKEDIIRRELTAVLTAGTLVDTAMISNDMSTYCLCLKEMALPNKSIRFGVSFVDTSTSEFNLCDLEDDEDRCLLETLIMQIKPREVVFERGELSQKTMRLLKNSLSSSTATLWNGLAPGKEFWDAATTAYEINEGKYFEEWPQALESIREKEHVLSSFGGLVSYLRSLKLDESLVSMKNIHLYDPVRQTGSLILDGQTLLNLEVFQNTLDGGERGTLHALLNRCVTPYGKRLFKKWLCHPLRSVEAINHRLDAIDDLNDIVDELDAVTSAWSRLPDLERLTSRIHAGGCKLKDFLTVLDGFRALKASMEKLETCSDSFKSKRLRDLCKTMFPFKLIREQLDFIFATFDNKRAREENEFVICNGVEEDYDEVVGTVKALEKEFKEYLSLQKRELGCPDLKYKDLGKELYQLEVPAKYISKVPRDWLKRSSTKAVNRYHSPRLINLVRKYQETLETRTSVLDSLYSRTLVKFDAHFGDCWQRAIECVSEVDCLISLARVSGVGGVLGVTRCRPTFVEGEHGQLDVRELRHPCIMTNSATDFIPNDICLGGDDSPSMVLLTGPNMGGKSTLLRQACVAIIMAQLGCYLPAASCKMTVFDRIFTRIGANDNILAGQSTFMVELAETSKILHQATQKSMVILDELGRGTATFDGYAIAYSVLHYLCQRVQCCGLFSTHYGLLTSEFSGPVCPTPSVRLMHMDCLVDENQRDVTFLYKLVDGVSPQSFGMNVASMAGIPEAIVVRAEQKAKEMQGEKGWIGCVGRKTNGDVGGDGGGADDIEDGKVAPPTKSRSLLVLSDFATTIRLLKNQEAVDKQTKCRLLLNMWKAAKARYQTVQ